MPMEIHSRICFFNRHSTEHNTFKPHSHDCYEIVYFLSGNGSAVINGQSFPFYENSYCIIAPHSEHVENINESGEILFVGFEYDNSAYEICEGMYYKGGSRIYDLIDDIMREYKDQYVGYDDAAKSLLDIMILQMSRNHQMERPRCVQLDYIKEYIAEHYWQKINFRQLSQMSGYSYDYFRHVFKKAYSVSPQEYLINIRIEKSCRLLCETKLSCTEISYMCGFSCSTQMSAMFKERFGKSPMEIRKADLYKNQTDIL